MAQMREESCAAQQPSWRCNQFFTPRYVVEFLTDNTLGRIWYEMTRGETKLKEQCRYLVRRPTENFLNPGETAAEQPKHDNLSQQDLLEQPVQILHRPLKDPRTILMLDPACGSMHFGLYAFDLYEAIYVEAWELEEKLDPAALIRPLGMKCLRHLCHKDLPRRPALSYRLHGIDIDALRESPVSLCCGRESVAAVGPQSSGAPGDQTIKHRHAEPMPGERSQREFIGAFRR